MIIIIMNLVQKKEKSIQDEKEQAKKKSQNRNKMKHTDNFSDCDTKSGNNLFDKEQNDTNNNFSDRYRKIFDYNND